MAESLEQLEAGVAKLAEVAREDALSACALAAYARLRLAAVDGDAARALVTKLAAYDEGVDDDARALAGDYARHRVEIADAVAALGTDLGARMRALAEQERIARTVVARHTPAVPSGWAPVAAVLVGLLVTLFGMGLGIGSHAIELVGAAVVLVGLWLTARLWLVRPTGGGAAASRARASLADAERARASLRDRVVALGALHAGETGTALEAMVRELPLLAFGDLDTARSAEAAARDDAQRRADVAPQPERPKPGGARVVPTIAVVAFLSLGGLAWSATRPGPTHAWVVVHLPALAGREAFERADRQARAVVDPHSRAWRAALTAARTQLAARPDLGDCPLRAQLSAAPLVMQNARDFGGVDYGPAIARYSAEHLVGYDSPLALRVLRNAEIIRAGYGWEAGASFAAAHRRLVSTRWTWDVAIVTLFEPGTPFGDLDYPDWAFAARHTRAYVFDYRRNRVVCIGDAGPEPRHDGDDPTLHDVDGDEARFERNALDSLAVAGPPR